MHDVGWVFVREAASRGVAGFCASTSISLSRVRTPPFQKEASLAPVNLLSLRISSLLICFLNLKCCQDITQDPKNEIYETIS
jgi:hypothetical protein